MGAKVTAPNAKVYDEIGDELVAVSGTGFPGANASMTNFRALANMANAAFVLFEIDGTEYALPLLLTA